MSELKRILRVYKTKHATGALIDDFQLCINLTPHELGLYMRGLEHYGFDSRILTDVFCHGEKVECSIVALTQNSLASFTCKLQNVCSSDSSSCPHFLATISEIIKTVTTLGLIPAGVRLPLGYERTAPMVESSDNTFWADTFHLCDDTCQKQPCKIHPASLQRYREMGEDIWNRIFNKISLRILLNFIAEFVEFVSQICVNPAIIADLPIFSKNPRYPFGMVSRRLFEVRIPFLPPQIMHSRVMSNLTSFFKKIITLDGTEIMVPRPIIFVIKPDLLITIFGQRKRIKKLGTGGFLRKLCKRLSQESESTTIQRLVMRRVLNKPDGPKKNYFVIDTKTFCEALRVIARQSNDGGILVKLLQMLEQMLGNLMMDFSCWWMFR